MEKSVKITLTVIALVILSVILVMNYYPPLKLKLFGGEIPISVNDIQFWVEQASDKNFYHIEAKYLKSPIDSSGGIYYILLGNAKAGGWRIVFNPEDNKIYGGGWWEKIVFCLGEGKIEKGIFKPTFLPGAYFTFIQGGSLELTSAPGYFINIYFPNKLKRLTEEELKKPSLAEILKEETRVKE